MGRKLAAIRLAAFATLSVASGSFFLSVTSLGAAFLFAGRADMAASALAFVVAAGLAGLAALFCIPWFLARDLMTRSTPLFGAAFGAIAAAAGLIGLCDALL